MFQSGSDNQWVPSQRDDLHGFYESEPHPHSWPQICPPQPSSTAQYSRSQLPYGGAYSRSHIPWYQDTWKSPFSTDVREYN
ncbi:hypothetical protein JOQ06_003420 [Pogonophryne albipinna]|uniref:Uncharacterized protein n=1 Tax=Pogonophryne albipinna TaxID=1090488 RepID=A0AAD6F7D8_9TELE|nr:hypothetical protein JOQ06_003420 [Pogonophryne albipinna]